jgi:CHAD domain-containing protein
VRDLDVYLLHKARYKALLPPPVRPDIEPLFAHLQRERSKGADISVRGGLA